MRRVKQVRTAAPAGVLAGRGVLAAFEVGPLSLGDAVWATAVLLNRDIFQVS